MKFLLQIVFSSYLMSRKSMTLAGFNFVKQEWDWHFLTNHRTDSENTLVRLGKPELAAQCITL